jgi:hypothetical protein
MDKFKVTLNWKCHYGYAEYDAATKTAEVVIEGAPEAVAMVRRFLDNPHTMDLPGEDGIRNFSTYTLEPLESLQNFKTCMTRIWVETGVRVEWSMPPGMADKL